MRTGLHTDEVTQRQGDVAGIAVHIGARVSELAEPGESLVTRAVRDLVAGSGIDFADRGEFTLEGLVTVSSTSPTRIGPRCRGRPGS